MKLTDKLKKRTESAKSRDGMSLAGDAGTPLGDDELGEVSGGGVEFVRVYPGEGFPEDVKKELEERFRNSPPIIHCPTCGRPFENGRCTNLHCPEHFRVECP